MTNKTQLCIDDYYKGVLKYINSFIELGDLWETKKKGNKIKCNQDDMIAFSLFILYLGPH